MDQFLFVEEYTGQPLLDAFAELLLQGRPDFTWSPERAEVRFSDVLPEFVAAFQDAAARLRAGESDVLFSAGSFPPASPWVSG
jgi:hypothetical protein